MGYGYGCPLWGSSKVMGRNLEKSYPPSQGPFEWLERKDFAGRCLWDFFECFRSPRILFFP